MKKILSELHEAGFHPHLATRVLRFMACQQSPSKGPLIMCKMSERQCPHLPVSRGIGGKHSF